MRPSTGAAVPLRTRTQLGHHEGVTSPPLHPDLARLAMLLGDWRGEGRGRWGEGAPFAYREEVHFRHSGKPFLAYGQRTTALDDGRPLHAEAGYWRAGPGAAVEVVMAQALALDDRARQLVDHAIEANASIAELFGDDR